PSQSPGRQPVERLWQFVDEPCANTYFGTIDGLDKTVGTGCVALMEQRDIRATCWRKIGFYGIVVNCAGRGKTRRGDRRATKLHRVVTAYGAACFSIARLMLTRLSAMTPGRTQRCIPT